MQNVEIAERLNEMADLLDVQDANEFRVRAYRNAARTIDNHTRQMAELLDEGEDLTELPNVGEDIAGYVAEMIRTGTFEALEQEREEVPEGLVEMLHLEGLGPRGVQTLYEEGGIASVEELQAAIEREELQAIEGYGPKKAENLQRAIETYEERPERTLLSEADQLVEPLLEHLREAEGLQRLEVAGSWRRRKETVGDLDVLAVCDDPEALMDHFTGWEAVARVEAAGETKGTVYLRSGLQVDLRIVAERSWGAALQYFTGSKEHGVACRKRALDRDLTLNEYGVFAIPEGADPDDVDPEEAEQVAGETEDEVYAALDLDWIPPELREDRGEIDAAAEGALPDLVELEDIRGDLQMHSEWSDGESDLEALVEAALDQGWEYIAITDHSPRLAMTEGLDADKAREQWEAIDRLDDAYDAITVLRGMEVDILEDGSLDMDDAILEELDVVVVGVHTHLDQDRDTMTERICTALEHPAVHVLVHPTERILNERDPVDLDLEEVLQTAKEHHVAVEIDASPDRLDLDDRQARRAKELGVMVAIDTDAHRPSNLSFMRYGVGQARRAWLEADDVLNTRSLDALRAWLEG